jgi:glycosyltransferase involved in cell wall biosynthesis
MPKVSVIIPTYQRAHLVSQAIESVLAQTYSDYEIIVVNNGSTDNTTEVLSQFGNKIRVIHIQENKGSSFARNLGMNASNGRYLAFLDDDDLWLPNKLEKQIPYLDSHSNIGLIYSNVFFFDEKGLETQSFAQKLNIHTFEQSWSMFIRFPIPFVTAVMRRECLNEVGGFDQTTLPCDDYDLCMRIVEKYPVYFLNEVLAYYRLSPDSYSRRSREKLLLGDLKVREKAFLRNPSIQKLPLAVLDTHFFNYYLTLAYFQLQRYQFDKSRQLLLRYQQLRGITGEYKWLWMMSFPILKPSPTNA